MVGIIRKCHFLRWVKFDCEIWNNLYSILRFCSSGLWVGLSRLLGVLVFLTCRGESAECSHVTAERIHKYLEYQSIISSIGAGTKTKTQHISDIFGSYHWCFSSFFQGCSHKISRMSGALLVRIGSQKMPCWGSPEGSSGCRKLERFAVGLHDRFSSVLSGRCFVSLSQQK